MRKHHPPTPTLPHTYGRHSLAIPNGMCKGFPRKRKLYSLPAEGSFPRLNGWHTEGQKNFCTSQFMSLFRHELQPHTKQPRVEGRVIIIIIIITAKHLLFLLGYQQGWLDGCAEEQQADNRKIIYEIETRNHWSRC